MYKLVSVFAAVAALCVATAPSAAWAATWTGKGTDTFWSTAANWDSYPANNSSASLVFREANPPNKTATLDAAYSYTGNIHLGKGSSAAAPYIFEATAAGNGLTIADDIWFGYYEDGWLWLKSGTYNLTTKNNKALHLGQGASGAVHNFWLKVGDGSSTATLSSTANHSYMKGGSALVADKATINFGSKNLNMYNTSAVYLTNSTMTAAYIYLHETSSMTLSNSTLTFSGDFNMPNSSGGNSVLRSVSGTLHHTGSSTVFNVGHGANSTGVVEKAGGDWDCYYLRIATGAGSSGTFTMNGGTLTVRNELGIGKGGNSTSTFTLNGGTVTAKYITSNDTASPALVIDGGTLKAAGSDARGMIEKANLNVTVRAGGATLDTAGYNVVVNTAFNRAADDPATVDVDESSGSLTVTGGGSARFAAVGNIAALTVGEDTGLRWFDADATVADYALDSLTLGAGSTFALDVDKTGCDTFSAATTNISATAEKKITFKLIVCAMPDPGRAFPLFAMTEAEAANYDVVAETPAGAPLVVEKGWANGFLTYAIFAKDYVWDDGANGGGWTDGAKWNVDGAAAEWNDSNNAVFAAAGDVATLDAGVTAVALDFRANATVNLADGVTAVLTVPEVSVASGVSASLNAPVSGAFEKKGAGTLALGTSRTEQTTLSEGTLTMAGATTLDWTKFVFGSDPEKPVTLRVDADATLANVSGTWNLGTVANITSTVVKAGGDWTVKNLYMAYAASADTTFVQEGGTLTLTSTADIGKSSFAAHAHFCIAGGTVAHSGYVHMGASSPGTMTVKAGAKYETTTAQSYGMIVGGSADATLAVEGGDVYVNGPINFAYYGANGPNGAANITAGGVLSCNGIKVNDNSSGGTGALSLDGGTLRANVDNAAFVPAKDNLTFKVGANGGTIDANGKTIVLGRPILEDVESTGGGMTFKGGGVVTLAAGNAYAGTTTVEAGTTVHIPALSDIGGGVVVTAPETPPADGVYALLAITGEETFPASVLTDLEAPTGYRLVLSGDSKTIYCIYGTPDPVWIGGASGSLSVGANWATGEVPTGGNCIIGNATAADLTIGDTFAPASITFPAGSALVTISGTRELSGLSSIVNDSAQHHVFACPVDGGALTSALPLADSNYLVFSGGIALTTMPSVENMRIAGGWNLTGNWNTPPAGATIMSGSTVNVSETLHNGYNLVIQSDATLRVDDMTAGQGASGKNRFLYQNDGTLIVAGETVDIIQSGGTTAYNLAGFFVKGNGSAVTRVNGLVHSGSTQSNHQFRLNNSEDSVENTIVLGSGGLSFRDNLRSNTKCYPYFQIDSGKSVVLASSADWSFGANAVSGKDLCLELAGSVTVDTSDYDDRTVAHTIRALGRIGNGGSMTVKGCGRLAFEYYSDFSGALAVQDTATVAFNVDCGFTRGGTATIGGGATLAVAESGTVALGKNLTLASGATLAFNFTEKETMPVLDMTGKTVTVNGVVNVKINAADDVRPTSGKHALTSGGKFADAAVSLAEGAPDWVKGVSVVDGEIVLEAKAGGTVVFVR